MSRQATVVRSTAGFTLVELLATIAIMVLAGIIVAAGIPVAQRAYVSVVNASDAQMLLSTTTNRLRDELSVAKLSTVEDSSDLSASDTLVSFESYETGYITKIKNTDDSGLWICASAPYDESTLLTNEPLVPELAAVGVGADSKLAAHVDSIQFENGVFVVNELKVQNGSETVGNASVSEFKVRPLAS